MREATQGQIVNPGGEVPEISIQVQGLSKNYGQLSALKNVSFTVKAGEVLGYLGPNGAGKTTTVNILCGLLSRDAGEVILRGIDIEHDPVAAKKQIGVVPEESNLYPELTSRRNLEYLGELYGLSRSTRRLRSDELLEMFNLADKAAVRFGALSRGMKRRLTIAAALVHSPPVIFLDEPTAGLDVPSARSLKSVIRSINDAGTTVFLTTHDLAVAESLCDRVLILMRGRVVFEGTAREIRQQVSKPGVVYISLSGPVEKESLARECTAIKAAALVGDRWRLEVSDTHEAVAQLVWFAGQQGVRLLEIDSATVSFEDAFMDILSDKAGTFGQRQ